MAVFVVVRPNPYISKKCRYMEEIGDGLVQPVTMVQDEGRYTAYKNFGFAIPMRLVRDSLLRIQTKGLDERGLRG